MAHRFFLRKFDKYYLELFRIPNNGKKIFENISNLEKYVSHGVWSNDSKDIRPLLEDISTGYFSEESDEISENEAQKLIAEFDRKSE